VPPHLLRYFLLNFIWEQRGTGKRISTVNHRHPSAILLEESVHRLKNGEIWKYRPHSFLCWHVDLGERKILGYYFYIWPSHR